ncbi:hypothetical protein EJ02DRAFT_437447 [Clathrospora elynae]|uniref:Uncharacterized protein n=1 Tax=Clathrospora elynae TaxID=706981 RepID=A0A6A5SKX3_9PLEO|nr:hypothetical protein EJ02DRAFT_437447 [Clathrospora elynae]
MAPTSANTGPANKQWLALRRKHDTELSSFQQQFEEAKDRLLRNVANLRAEILARHAKEEKVLGGKANGGAKTSQHGNANNPAALSTRGSGAQKKTNRKVTATPAKTPIPRLTTSRAQTQSEKTPIPSSKATQAQLASRPAHSKSPVTYIDLCSSDDDEPGKLQKKSAPAPVATQAPQPQPTSSKTVEPPASSIPSANLELFGNIANTSWSNPEVSRLKREESVLGQRAVRPFTPPSPYTSRTTVPGTSSPDFAQRASTIALSFQPATVISPHHGFGSQAPSNPFTSSALQGQDRSTITRFGAQKSPFAASASQQRLGQYQALISQPLTAQAPQKNKSTAQVPSSSNIASWVTPTISSFQGLGMQRQTLMAPYVSTPPTSQNNGSPLDDFASWRAPPQASGVAPQSQQSMFRGIGQPSAAKQTSFHGLLLEDGIQARLSDSDAMTTSQREQTSGSNSMIKPDDQDAHIDEDPQTPPKSASDYYVPTTHRLHQHTLNMPPSPSHSSDPPDTTNYNPRTHEPSSSSSQISIAGSVTPKTPSGFKMPTQPASATKDPKYPRYTHAGSQASSAILPNSRSQRGTSVTSRTSISSSRMSVTGGRKRKVVDISSDEEGESDYAPPSDDDDGELHSPEEAERGVKGKKDTVKQQEKRPAVKRAKMPPPPPLAMAAKGAYSKGKNAFGFNDIPKTKPRSAGASKPLHTSTIPSKKNLRPAKSLATQALPPCVRAASARPPAAPPISRTPSARPRTQVSQRKAKPEAEEKISQLSEAEEFWTQESIVDAEEQKDCVVRQKMRRMSITPAPAPSRIGSVETNSRGNDVFEDVLSRRMRQ